MVAAEDHRERGLDRPRVRRRVVDRRPAAEDRAGREVLDLALAVDRRVGDDRDRLLEVVGEVLALGRERRQRAVVAERADRLGAVRRHLLDELDVVALPAEAGEDAVRDLDRLRRDRPRSSRGPRRPRAGRRSRARARRARPRWRRCARASGRGRGAASRSWLCSVEARLSRSIVTITFSPGASGFGSETRSPTETTPGSELKTKSSARLELPERPQAHRVGGEHALVVVARDQRHRPLRERAHRLAQVHVEAVQLRREGRRISSTIGGTTISIASARLSPSRLDQRVDDPVEVLGVGVAGLDRDAEHARLLAQLLDRVDLAVVAEDRERLHALERGPGVGRVAVVAEGSRSSRSARRARSG